MQTYLFLNLPHCCAELRARCKSSNTIQTLLHLLCPRHRYLYTTQVFVLWRLSISVLAGGDQTSSKLDFNLASKSSKLYNVWEQCCHRASCLGSSKLACIWGASACHNVIFMFSADLFLLPPNAPEAKNGRLLVSFLFTCMPCVAYLHSLSTTCS